MDIQTKECSVCRREFPLTSDHWYWDKKNNKTSSGACRTCHKARSRQWRADNVRRNRQLQDCWKYGISEEEQVRLRAVTHCQVCGSDNDGRSLHIDHCHRQGHVRGVLCAGCNSALGHAKDNPETLRRLADYLVR